MIIVFDSRSCELYWLPEVLAQLEFARVLEPNVADAGDFLLHAFSYVAEARICDVDQVFSDVR